MLHRLSPTNIYILDFLQRSNLTGYIFNKCFWGESNPCELIENQLSCPLDDRSMLYYSGGWRIRTLALSDSHIFKTCWPPMVAKLHLLQRKVGDLNPRRCYPLLFSREIPSASRSTFHTYSAPKRIRTSMYTLTFLLGVGERVYKRIFTYRCTRLESNQYILFFR